ncbi:MAG: endolytic transglycosylase MltG, partial [Polyangiales bacterium]
PTCARWLAAGTIKTNAEIQHDPLNRWSTYTHAGLPPTAIASPGEKSIAAVLQPASTKYLYFVARGGGHHTFSETREAHDRAVKGATSSE